VKVPKRSLSAKGTQRSGRPPSGLSSQPPSGSTSHPQVKQRPVSGPGLTRANGVERNPFSGLDSRVAIATTISKLENEGMTEGDGGVTDDEVVPLAATGIGPGLSLCLYLLCLCLCLSIYLLT
jgi:hypothetical protein